MSEINVNKLVGESFEDMSIVEMTLVQGSGDIDPKAITSSMACVSAVTKVTKTVTQITAAWTATQLTAQSIKTKC